MLSLAYDNGLIDSNPVPRVRLLREPPPRKGYLAGEEEGRLLAALRPYGDGLEALAALGPDTGLRLSGLLRLRWEDVGGSHSTFARTAPRRGRRTTVG